MSQPGRKPPGKPHWRGAGRSFGRNLLLHILFETLVVLALIEAIFLAEKLPSVFNAAVDKQANLTDIAGILLTTAPQIFDLALGIAFLIAVYRVVLQAREERELVALAGAGIGTLSFLAPLIGLALLVQTGALLVSGGVEPAAHFAGRRILFNAEYRALRKGVAAGQFYFFPNHVVYAEADAHHGTDRKLFVWEQLGGGVERVFTAQHAGLTGPDSRGLLSLVLRDFQAHNFPAEQAARGAASAGDCVTCLPVWSGGRMTIKVRDLVQMLTLEEILPFTARAQNPDEVFLFEAAPPGADTVLHTRLMGERLARSFLCLIGPLLALAAIVFTGRKTMYVALPAACLALLVLDIAGAAMVRALAPAGAIATALVPLAAVIALGAGLTLLLVRRQNGLIRPGLNRS